ncbi:uncharacterized protein EDB93DRAFT_1181494 [Suillus bovinus]|uniref:uncharacterized protein n=1 Tax=Suillus bovinus TaxID=48563 RepID=UPI001B85D581|nr:uncharacterized protein EDB93DRAFT_1181494 [Suillus bovinus]KAG2129814.1 hypothetical protein EDB93DRAFT_1181494 [Suillus bovinus]
MRSAALAVYKSSPQDGTTQLIPCFFTNSSRLIMSINTSPRALLTSFFVLLTLLSCALCAPVPAVMRRDVWVPTIICPTSDSTWTVGGTFLVTWDTSSEPAEVTNPTGKIYLRQGDATQSNPIASGFPLTDGQVDVTIPDDTTPGTYMIVLFGDSGNWSQEFSIDAAT